MRWQDIATRDPYLAGSVAAREHEWFEDMSALEEADRVGLQGEQREKFIQGWHAELAEQEQERKERLEREREAYLDDLEHKVLRKGDPVNW